MADISDQTKEKLLSQSNIWFASVRPNGKPHLVPVWFTWQANKLFICIDPASVKARNLENNQSVALALEDGLKPVICEGIAQTLASPYPVFVCEEFKRKYDWDITTEAQYTRLVEITPTKWLTW